jgi:hypothetical protein
VGGIFRSLSLPRFAWALVRSVCFLLVDIGSSTHRFVGARLCSSRDRIHPKAKASVRLIDWGSALLKEMHNRPVRPPLAPPASAGSDATRTPFELPLRPSAPSLRLAPECAPNRYAIPLGPANWGLGAWKQRLKITRGGGGRRLLRAQLRCSRPGNGPKFTPGKWHSASSPTGLLLALRTEGQRYCC